MPTGSYVYLHGSTSLLRHFENGRCIHYSREALHSASVPWQKSGSPNPGWSEKLASGEPVGSPYVRIAHTAVVDVPSVEWAASGYEPGYKQYTSDRSGVTYPDGRHSTEVAPTERINSARELATFDYYNGKRGVQSLLGGFDGLTFIGEFPKAVQALSYRASALGEATVKGFKRLDRRTRRVQKRIADYQRRTGKKQLPDKLKVRLRTSLSAYYLEYWFGLYPLVQSVLDLRDAFKAPLTVRAVGRGKVVWRTSRQQGLSMFSGASATYQLQCKHAYSVQLTGFYALDDLLAPDLSLGFSFDDLALTAWELVPLSWMFDYWVRVSEWLTAEKLSRLTPVRCYRSDRYTMERYISNCKFERRWSTISGYITNRNPRARALSLRLTRDVVSTPRVSVQAAFRPSNLKDGPTSQQRTYMAAAASVMTKRFRHLTKLL